MRVAMNRVTRWVAAVLLIGFAASTARADPVDLVLNPSPQEFSNTCQSYSMGLAMAFHPSSPFAATTPTELRELERRLRKALTDSAAANNHPVATREDWKVAVETVSNDVLTVSVESFKDLDPAMQFVAQKTAISNPEGLGDVLSAALVSTPVMMSFTRIESSDYKPQSHIVTVFGVQLPNASMDNTAHPKLLLVNSAVKYANNVKNICAQEALSDNDRYRAMVSLTDNYELNLFGNTKPYVITYISKK
ncbi:hypothetical protein ATY76_21465 [Rhizobium sp. R339]|uniref:hypothetical protein n=1 Tax=Rhizobium sp. R339 TaxID=1764273 RepID=UPI000B5313AF|nr:hypothetical protein [Rhizobium sp. R339]OWV64036.1 hypothetical protein ATY76_21465 [Rhizobium sp. R339]